MRHVLVTGGAGFIGSHLVDHLLHRGCRVDVLDDFSTGRRENLVHLAHRIDITEGDVRSDAVVRQAAAGGVEVMFHLAALTSVPRSLEQPTHTADVNVSGTLRVLEAARALGVRRVVFASSSSVYGDAGGRPRTENLPLRPRSPYAASKAAGESFARAYQESFGLEVAVLRFFNVYGPRQRATSPYAAAVPRFISAVLEGQPPVIEGDGEQTRDFTYVRDVVRAIARAGLSSRACEGPINVGAGSRTSIRALIEVVARACGASVVPEFTTPRGGDIRHARADIRRARERLGWSPSTSLPAGIGETVRRMRRPIQT